MKKQKRIISSLLAATTALSFCGMSLSVQNTFADNQAQTKVKVSNPSVLKLTISNDAIEFNATDEVLHTDSLNVTVNTNNASGYDIFVNSNTDHTELKHVNTAVSQNIPTLSSQIQSSSFPTNQWGYSLDNALYEGIKLEPKKIYESKTHGTDTYPFYIGTKISSGLVAGTFENEIIFTGVANPTVAAGTAKAILGANGNLNFLYDNVDYAVGDTYTDNLGQTTVAAVYDVPVNSTSSADIPWNLWSSDYSCSNDNITSANFSDSFKNFHPTSTHRWFSGLCRMTALTNAKNLDTSNVTDMAYMFYGAGEGGDYVPSVSTPWTLDLSSWDVSKVTDMKYMFYSLGAISTNELTVRGLSNWDVSKVTDMSYMFKGVGTNAPTWSLGDLSRWNVGQVTNMTYMFAHAGYNVNAWTLGDLSNWNVSKVTDMSFMFDSTGGNSSSWSVGSLANWDVSSVTNMQRMFHYAGSQADVWSLDLSNWNVGNVTDMYGMFAYSGIYGGTSWSVGDLSRWNVSNVTDMGTMFDEAGEFSSSWYAGDLSGWDTSNVTGMWQMFHDAGKRASDWSIGDVSGWNVNKVTYHVGFCDAHDIKQPNWLYR